MSRSVVDADAGRREDGGGRPGRRARPLLAGAALLAMLCGGTVAAAAQQVAGTVTGPEGGAPLPGVQVTVKGSPIGTRTDAAGRYSLAVQSLAGDTLVFALLGYRQREVPIGGRTAVDVAMEREAVSLEGVVVVGYGTQQRRDLTGSVSSVDTERLTEVATPNVTQALQGRVAGVQVTPQSGEPGQGAVVRIRGVGTLNNASPLYVVDGMLLDDITFLNPNDITSMDVLKDASATAIYGSRGANGVIIVTTRKGDQAGGTRFAVSAYTGTQEVANQIELVNAQEYAILSNELAANTGVARPYFENPAAVGAGVDWQNEIFRSAPIQSYQMSAQGGSERVRYYFSGNFVRQAGVIEKSDYSRVTLRLNNDYELTDRLSLGHNINFAYSEDQRAPNVVGALYRADPTIAPRNDQGEFSDLNLRASAGNPEAAIFYTRNGGDGGRLVGNLFADLDLTDDVSFRSSFGLDYDRNDFRSLSPAFFVSPTQRNNVSTLRVETVNRSSWLWENTADYTYVSDRQRVTVLAGITTQQFYDELLGGNRTNVAGESESLWYLNAGGAEGQTNENRASDWRMLSYLFRTNYTLLDRYLFTASMRVDGSSRFGSENRYGWFPSLALGWNLDQEDFFQGLPMVSNLKLRGSWGQIGNDKIGSYPGIPVVTSNLNAVFGQQETLTLGASPVELANPEVQWERTTQTNIGADMAFFDGRVSATVDWYRRLTDGILVRVPIPGFVGVTTQPFVNAAEVLNSGLEGTLTWADAFGDLGFELSVNGSTLDNEVRELGGGREEILGGGLGNEIGVTTRTVVGEPIGSFWGFRTDGVFQNAAEIAAGPLRGGERPGDLRYADLNGDGRITDADKTFLGSPIPDFIYGATASLDWRGFDLSASIAGQAGNEVFNGKKAVRFGVENFERSFLDRWNGEGTSSTEPRVTNAGHNYQASERFIEDGSFLRLQSAQLGYRLPEKLTARLGVDRARLYLGGTNLLMLSDYSGYTPELVRVDPGNPSNEVLSAGIDLGVYPPVRTLTIGIDLGF